VLVIDQLTQFMDVRAAEILVEPVQQHQEPTDLLEQLTSLALPSSVSMSVLHFVNNSLAPSSSCRFRWLSQMGWVA